MISDMGQSSMAYSCLQILSQPLACVCFCTGILMSNFLTAQQHADWWKILGLQHTDGCTQHAFSLDVPKFRNKEWDICPEKKR
mmetsp:Transcript_99135/g.167099  ORF Transcript_99135/g.167099 Transcript_99135/m.167099 type:complete len:83 (-) Transcript_99135:1273-1521(-)